MATAFAIFSTDDYSLTFYNRDVVPVVGNTYNGKTVSEVYTGFETETYISYENDNYEIVSSAPWGEKYFDIISVSFADKITPSSTAAWFVSAYNMTSFDATNLDTNNVTAMNEMFYFCNSLTSLDLSNFNTISVTDMSKMFHNCSGLTSLDVSSFDTSNVAAMNEMFVNCSSLTTLNLGNFNTSQVTNMESMFYDCSGLTTLDLSSFDTSQVTNMETMFYNCSGLTTLNLSSFDTSQVTTMKWMFDSCSALTTLNLSSFDTKNVTNTAYMFQDCSSLTTIYVSEIWTTDAVTSSSNMFSGCTNLKGGNNTKVADKQVYDKTYASIDTEENEGYLTYKKYIDPMYKKDFLINGMTVLNLADKIRVLNGTEESMTPAEMDTNLTTANTEVGSQSDIIAQIISALGMNELTFVLEANSELPTEMYSSNTHVCSFVKGMTWAEWIGSEYNTDGYYLFEDGDISSSVRTPDGLMFGTYDVGTDLIEAKTYYVSLS